MANPSDLPGFTPIRSRRTFEEAVGQIAEAITSRRLRVGDRLPSERALADAMQVGRPTVREALAVLARAGSIEYVGSGRGAGARVVSDLLPVNLVEDRTDLRVSEVGGVLLVRRMLEPRIAQLASVERADDDLDRLHALLSMQQDALRNRTRFLELDLAWHLEVARCSHNATLVAVFSTFVRRLEKAYDLALRDSFVDADLAFAHHQGITRAIAGRDPDSAEQLMEVHLRILESHWEDESGYSFHTKLPGFLLKQPLGETPGTPEPSNERWSV